MLATNVMVLMDLLQCGKGHPKVASIIEDQELLRGLVMVAMTGTMEEFYKVIRYVLLFVVRHVEEDRFLPLVVYNKNKTYLPNIWKHVGVGEVLSVVDELIDKDKRDGFCSQTVFEFLMGMLSEVNEDELGGVVERILFVLSMTDSKKSLVRLVVPKHNLKIWEKTHQWLQSLLGDTLTPLDTNLLNLCFALLRLETSYRKHKSHAPHVVEMGKTVYQASVLTLKLYCNFQPKELGQHQGILRGTSFAIEMIYLLHRVGAIDIQTVKSTFYTSLTSLLITQAQSFTNHLNIKAHELLNTPRIALSGPFHVSLCSLLKKLNKVISEPSEVETKTQLIAAFFDLSMTLKVHLSLNPLPLYFVDALSWVLPIHSNFIRDTSDTSTNQQMMEVLAGPMGLLKVKWTQRNPEQPPQVKRYRKMENGPREELVQHTPEQLRQIEELTRKIQLLESQQAERLAKQQFL